MEEHAYERLPKGYELYEKVDLTAGEAKKMGMIGLILTAFMIIWGMFAAKHPISEAFQMETFRVVFAFCGMLIGMVVYLFVHEGVHGFFIKMFSGQPPFYGKNLKMGMFYAGSHCFFARTAYIVIALAPVIIWTAVLAILLTELSVNAPEFWWYVFTIQILNITGASGDLYISWRVLRMPQNVLVQDDGIVMRFYVPQGMIEK